MPKRPKNGRARTDDGSFSTYSDTAKRVSEVHIPSTKTTSPPGLGGNHPSPDAVRNDITIYTRHYTSLLLLDLFSHAMAMNLQP